MRTLKIRSRVAILALSLTVMGSGCSEDTEKGQFTVDLSAAMKISRCLDVPIGRIGDSRSQTSEYLTQVACVASAKSCPEVATCLNATGSACDPSIDRNRCNGTQLTSCLRLPGNDSYGVSTVTDCATSLDGNTTCGTYDSCFGLSEEEREVRGCPTRASCVASSCMEQSATCDGTDVVICDGGVVIRQDCSRLGLTCVRASGEASCAQPGNEICSENFCSGGNLVLCSLNEWSGSGRPAEQIDCGDLHPDFACIESESGSYCGVSTPNRVCESGERECINERTVGVCAQGVWVTGSCAPFLNGRCEYSTQGLRCVESDDPPENISEPEAPRPNNDPRPPSTPVPNTGGCEQACALLANCGESLSDDCLDLCNETLSTTPGYGEALIACIIQEIVPPDRCDTETINQCIDATLDEGTGEGQLGDPCESSSDCVGVCASLPGQDGQICVDSCTNGMCPSGFTCSQNYCIPAQGGAGE